MPAERRSGRDALQGFKEIVERCSAKLLFSITSAAKKKEKRSKVEMIS